MSKITTVPKVQSRSAPHFNAYLHLPLGILTSLHIDHNRYCGIFYVFMIVCGSVATPVLVIGVTLLGWSSFELDTVQGNG